MAATKSSFFTISNSTLFTIAGLFIANLFAVSKSDQHATFSIHKEETLVSESISWNEAEQMRNMFKSLKPMMIELPDESNPGAKTSVPLEGFKISASHLLEIINQNKNGGTADEVMFYFGAESPKAGFNNPSFNIIAVGMKNDTLMIPNNSGGRANAGASSIYDKADPCPPMCPN